MTNKWSFAFLVEGASVTEPFGRTTDNTVDRNFDFNTWIAEALTEAVHKGASDVVLYTNAEGDRMDCEVRINGQMYWLRAAEGPRVSSLVVVFRRDAKLATAGDPIPKEAVFPVRMPLTGEEEMARAVVFKGFEGEFIAQLRLPSVNRVVTMGDLKFGKDNEQRIRKLLDTPGRMVMVAGPMGAGKSSTVHGMLESITGGSKTIWTIEDPVERKLPGTFQLQADEVSGYGFAEFLPHMVRADYDTLFIGEIRDKITAAAAVRQSKAGREIITTIHADDNIVALLRLIELAEDTPLAVLDSVKGVISQRLVPTLNPQWDGKDPAGKYNGRRPINEVLMVDREIIQAYMDKVSLAELRQMIDETGKSTNFFEDSHRLVEDGLTDWAAIGGVLGMHQVEMYLDELKTKERSAASAVKAEPAPTSSPLPAGSGVELPTATERAVRVEPSSEGSKSVAVVPKVTRTRPPAAPVPRSPRKRFPVATQLPRS